MAPARSAAMIKIPINRIGLPETIWFDSGTLFLLDQRRLPHDVAAFKVETVDQAFEAIADMVVRGAPAIGVTAAYAMILGIKRGLETEFNDVDQMVIELKRRRTRLIQARPTAVNLAWALDRMLVHARSLARSIDDVTVFIDRLIAEAVAIHDEDRNLCRAIGEHGSSLITPGGGVLTHCNAGSLATSEYGTATAPMYIAHAEGQSFRVFADETRPRLQGAKLTAWELGRSGIDVTLITDSMAASLMARGMIDLVIVGTDRVAANGDVANKIGTLSVAIAAKHYGIPFYVALPYSTIDPATPDGDAIEIEYRSDGEVTRIAETKIAGPDTRVINPAFDVTPANLVTAFITERGIIEPPFDFTA